MSLKLKYLFIKATETKVSVHISNWNKRVRLLKPLEVQYLLFSLIVSYILSEWYLPRGTSECYRTWVPCCSKVRSSSCTPWRPCAGCSRRTPTWSPCSLEGHQSVPHPVSSGTTKHFRLFSDWMDLRVDIRTGAMQKRCGWNEQIWMGNQSYDWRIDE